MKNLIIAILIITPLITFSQTETISKKEKKAIDNYLNDLCICVNEVLNSLNPTMVEYVQILSKEGETVAQSFMNDFISNASEEEKNEFVASASLMQTQEFGTKLEDCDSKDKTKMSQKNIDEIDNENGPSYDYLMVSLTIDSDCKLTNMFMNMSETNK